MIFFNLPVVEGTIFRTMVGTPQYVAPEIVMQTAAKPGYDLLVDSWSIGVIVFSMMSNVSDDIQYWPLPDRKPTGRS